MNKWIDHADESYQKVENETVFGYTFCYFIFKIKNSIWKYNLYKNIDLPHNFKNYFKI